MGAAFDCRCNGCGHEFKVMQGGGFTFIHVCCDGCGDTKPVPRFAPRERPHPTVIPAPLLAGGAAVKTVVTGQSSAGSVPKMSKADIQAYLHQRPWLRGCDSWTETEWRTLLSLLGRCPCGGDWVEPNLPSDGSPHALHRCPQCRSKSFGYWLPQVLFD